ncbi:MAG: site-specific integrase [Magnetospirillum gryphiswaldense]|nr:site-specific integrase [Magnetospirillum gryphiswaldense]
MSRSYRIEIAVFATGERMPLLIGDGGLPLYEPTLYILTEIRARGRAAHTVEQALRAIKVLYIYGDSADIDVEQRIRSGTMLTIPEIDGLVNAVRKPIDQLKTFQPSTIVQPPKAISLEAVRTRMTAPGMASVDPATASIRLRYIEQYLGWLSLTHLSRLGARSNLRPSYEAARNTMLQAIHARIPKGRCEPTREGLPEEVIAELLRVITIDCPDNPWRQLEVRRRNRLIVLMLHILGLRAGELLALKVDDIDWRQNKVTVTRRPDDPDDPRVDHPRVKTRGRRLPLPENLVKDLHHYVIDIRGQRREAAFHPFLFVESDRGRPLSMSALTKVFGMLGAASASLTGLSPHLLRHSWNDRFSKLMDKKRVSEADEVKMRSYLMGWSETSGTAGTYTRRHTRDAAMKVSRELQEGLMEDERG